MSLVCTTPQCSEGRSKVAAMWDTLNQLKSQNANFRYDNFLPTCTAIQGELDSVDSWYAGLIPFNPVCCTISDIGDRASALSSQMLTSVGAAGIPKAPGDTPDTDWVTVAVVGGVALLLLVYSPQIKSAFK
jgi:hypothetical protein